MLKKIKINIFLHNFIVKSIKFLQQVEFIIDAQIKYQQQKMILYGILIIFHLSLATLTLSKQNIDSKKTITSLDPIQFTILNKGQSLKISLQQYFPFSQSYSIDQSQSTQDIQQILNIDINSKKIQVEESQKLSAYLKDKQISLSQFTILDVKTIYNQPNKIFLLNQNLLLMYSYRQKSQSKVHMNQNFEKQYNNYYKNQQFQDYPKVTVLNITAQANIAISGYQNFTCIETEALPLESYYKFIILCNMRSNTLPFINLNYIVSFNMEQDSRGFITHLIFNSTSTLETKLQEFFDDQANNKDKQKSGLNKILKRNKKRLWQNPFKQKYFQKLNQNWTQLKIIQQENGLSNIKMNIQKNDSYQKQISDHQVTSQPIKTKGGSICDQYHIKYFNNIVVDQYQLYQTIIAYCTQSQQQSSIKQVFQVRFEKGKVNTKPIINMKYLNITGCLLNSKYITQYQNGFVSVISNFLYKYSPKINARGGFESKCQSFNSVSLYQYKFITSRNQSGIQIIYIIFQEKIMIFQSYSPNYQTLNLNNGGLILKSYAISNQILSLHYQNPSSQQITILAYNIKSIYPHLIDKVSYKINPNTGIYLFSVMNYLQKGNYFFIYERFRNLFNLTFYDGQFVTVQIKDQARAVGDKVIAIINSSKSTEHRIASQEDQNFEDNTIMLPIKLKIRDFCDASNQVVEIDEIKINNKFFNIDLVKATIGPLGRFYKMSNSQSSLQFVNSFYQIDIAQILDQYNDKRLITFSINTFLKNPIITFYFQSSLFLTCDLQFDYDLTRPEITRCVKITDMQDPDNKPNQIIIYQQGKFLQHQGHRIMFCKIATNVETQCVEGDFQVNQIKKIKLIKYQSLDDGSQFISIFLIFDKLFKQKDYIKRYNNQIKKDEISISVNLQITGDEIEYLQNMHIKTLEYDQGYENFLLIHMIEHFNPVTDNDNNQLVNKSKQTDFNIIQIYSKPQLQTNQSSHFVGHLIQQFVSTQLQSVFIINNKIILLFILDSGSTIQQYTIQNFKCIKNRVYPLYDHSIVKNGSHSFNSGFLFVQVQDPELAISKYLVYNPSLNSASIITHSFQKYAYQSILFAQKVQQSNNVMAINGKKLITLCLPNIVIKLNQGRKRIIYGEQNESDNALNQNNLSLLKKQSSQIKPISSNFQQYDKVKLSFVDNNDILKIIQFKYFYDISDSKIIYNHSIPQKIKLKEPLAKFQLQIDPKKIYGPVSQYNIENQTYESSLSPFQKQNNLCDFITFNSSDIFTKTKCIKYYNSKEDGIMQDFLTFQRGLYDDISIIVTDKKILCVDSMKILNFVPKSKTKQCNLYLSEFIFLVCSENNKTTMSIIQMYKNCQLNITQLIKPAFLKYNLFKMTYTSGQAIFQVPIRSQSNKIYYVTKFSIQNDTFVFDQNSVLLKHMSQQQFATKDFTTNHTFMYLLQDGLGIYNLTRRNQVNQKISPDVWISGNQLRKIFGVNESFAYINFLSFNLNEKLIVLQIGTTLRSFQTGLTYSLINDTFRIDNISVLYVYRNPWSCFNTQLSKAKYYKTMTIKMCSFMPEQHYVFSNFIPITQNKQNSYIIFYQKNFNKNQSYPFRMDIIYTNIYSNDNFQIPFQKGKLLIGSLFNLLCEYDLRDSYNFTFTLDKKIIDYINDNQIIETQQKKAQCHYSLNLSNQNSQTLYPIIIKIDLSDQSTDMWTDWKHWIQRIIFLAIIINFIRLQIVKRRQKKRMSRIKTKISRSDSFDQQFDLQVRFHSKKSL